MTDTNEKRIKLDKKDINIPSFAKRIFSVWYRHYRVYTSNLISNALPPFLEPLLFIAGIGIGLGMHISEMDGISYVKYLATGIPVISAMYTASFECTYGTFIRLEFDKIYDGMLSSSISARNLLLGEMLFAATKGFFFVLAIVFVIFVVGKVSELFGMQDTADLISMPMALLAPFGGFLTGLMFAGLGFFVTSFVKTINHFNFYFTGVLTPLFFFSGVFFPISQLPDALRIAAEILPLTHSTKIVRAFCLNSFDVSLVYDFLYTIVFSIAMGYIGIKMIVRKLVY